MIRNRPIEVPIWDKSGNLTGWQQLNQHFYDPEPKPEKPIEEGKKKSGRGKGLKPNKWTREYRLARNREYNAERRWLKLIEQGINRLNTSDKNNLKDIL